MVLTVVIALPWIVAMGYAAVRQPRSAAGRVFAGYGLVGLAAAPAVVVQDVVLLLNWMPGYSFQWHDLASIFFKSWQSWCLIGGFAVSRPFDLWVKELTGHRQTTMMDNWWVYYIATLVWATPSALFLSRRLASGRPWHADQVIWMILGIVLANALGGVTFPWWGS